jgi:uncharacterized protein YdeI (YjbR/CyaY-like superfamily)
MPNAARRPRHPMPEFLRKALNERGLLTAYQDRPAYQRNDYIWWITSPKRPQTREKRLVQMLDELAKGGVYMGMSHGPSRKPRSRPKPADEPPRQGL